MLKTDHGKLPVTVILAIRNEAANLPKCLAALKAVERVIVVDSGSTDGSDELCRNAGAELVQFDYAGGYPKKRQWAMDTIPIHSEWTLLLDADEVVPAELWSEIGAAIRAPGAPDAFLLTKGFHFLGRRLRFGGFSFAAVLLFRTGKARFERLIADVAKGLDMEVHERVLVDGRIGRLSTPVVHEDFKDLEAYIDRHNKYSTWEARLRFQFLTSGRYGENTITPRLFGNAQECRRFLKAWIIRLPGEPWLWFIYHYLVRLGFVEGRPGLIAAQIRASYIAQVRAKLYEMRLGRSQSE